MQSKAEERSKVQSPTIFIVDDDDAVRDSLKLLLESYGMTVEDFGSAAEFKNSYRPGVCECLILDQHLPGITGLDFLSSVGGPLPHLPVILMTGRGDRAIRDRAARLGVSAYLEKPIGDGILMAAIRHALKERQDCDPAPAPTH
jgi:FixJ family two-component response regulator